MLLEILFARNYLLVYKINALKIWYKNVPPPHEKKMVLEPHSLHFYTFEISFKLYVVSR